MQHLLNHLHDFLYLEEHEGQDFQQQPPPDSQVEILPLLQHLLHFLETHDDFEQQLQQHHHDDDKMDMETTLEDVRTGYEEHDEALLTEPLQVVDLFKRVAEMVLLDVVVVEWVELSQLQPQELYL